MKEIVVLSGKGGTGKTSLTASLAVLASGNMVIADCDVDAANLHLLLKPEIQDFFDFYSGELAVINPKLCTLCGRCARICRFHAISLDNSSYRIENLNCEGCGYCEIVCPESAITMVRRKSGQIFKSKTRLGSTLIHARMEIGAENSGKLVARVKQEARSQAGAEQKEFILIDGAPGIGCPVTSSIAGADYVILVTEPTVSGIFDLKRIFEVIQEFRIKTGAVINKCDLNPKNAEELKVFFRQNRIEHLADIPFDIKIPKAMSEGRTIAETEPSYQALFQKIWKRITERKS